MRLEVSPYHTSGFIATVKHYLKPNIHELFFAIFGQENRKKKQIVRHLPLALFISSKRKEKKISPIARKHGQSQAGGNMSQCGYGIWKTTCIVECLTVAFRPSDYQSLHLLANLHHRRWNWWFADEKEISPSIGMRTWAVGCPFWSEETTMVQVIYDTWG